jgi:hypothetical protein
MEFFQVLRLVKIGASPCPTFYPFCNIFPIPGRQIGNSTAYEILIAKKVSRLWGSLRNIFFHTLPRKFAILNISHSKY